jgi:DNA-directed RNA polymerase I, II, and III subunit RPABC1
MESSSTGLSSGSSVLSSTEKGSKGEKGKKNTDTSEISSSDAQEKPKVSQKLIPSLLPIEMNSEKCKNTVLTNVIKMLTERKLLKRELLDKNIETVLAINTDDLTYKILLDVAVDGHTIMIVRVFPHKITSTAKSSEIIEFFKKNANIPKIAIVNDINEKNIYSIKDSYPNTEIFLEKELMINIIEHVAVPKHVVLSDEEAKNVLEEYGIKKRYTAKIYDGDPISRYYNVKAGQIFRIERASETSGLTPTYRLVIRGNIASGKT